MRPGAFGQLNTPDGLQHAVDGRQVSAPVTASPKGQQGTEPSLDGFNLYPLAGFLRSVPIVNMTCWAL